jgi:hypothetical protein
MVKLPCRLLEKYQISGETYRNSVALQSMVHVPIELQSRPTSHYYPENPHYES